MKKEIRTEIEINASAEKVWKILTDLENFSEWNPFVVKAQGNAKEGQTLKIEVQIPDSRLMKFTPLVLKSEPNKELRWVGTSPLGSFRGEHFYQIETLGENKVRFIHGENFSGWLVRLTWFLEGKRLEKAYQLMNEALKKRAENL